MGRTSSEHPVILSSSVKSVSPEPQSSLGFCGSYSLLSLLSLALTPCLFSLSLPSQYRLGCGLAQAFHLDCLNMFSWFVRPLVARPSKTGKPSSSHCGLLGPAKYESEGCRCTADSPSLPSPVPVMPAPSWSFPSSPGADKTSAIYCEPLSQDPGGQRDHV